MADTQKFREPLATPAIRQITIVPVRGGYILTVGCHTFTFTDTGEMLERLDEYLDNPVEVEKLYMGTPSPFPENQPAVGVPPGAQAFAQEVRRDIAQIAAPRNRRE